MAGRVEFDYYIPPDVIVEADGDIPVADWNKVYQFNVEDDEFNLLSFTGMGMPPMSYITQRGPFQHGMTALDYRLDPRVIQYIHRRNTCKRTGYWSARADILNKLRVNRQLINDFRPGRLRKIQPDGTIRDIFALIEFGPVFSARNLSRWDEWSFTETIRFICHDPTWFDPALEEAVWDVDFFGNLVFYETPDWEDRAIFPIVFGADIIEELITITYVGTWLTYPTITVIGPLDNFLIENQATGEKIELTYNIANGETITINLAFGNKTVTSNVTGNIIGTVTDDSDLATFHIAPDPEAPGGSNILFVYGSDVAIGTTETRVTWNTRYIGI